jgi:hypothetical protein
MKRRLDAAQDMTPPSSSGSAQVQFPATKRQMHVQQDIAPCGPGAFSAQEMGMQLDALMSGKAKAKSYSVSRGVGGKTRRVWTSKKKRNLGNDELGEARAAASSSAGPPVESPRAASVLLTPRSGSQPPSYQSTPEPWTSQHCAQLCLAHRPCTTGH